MSGSCWLPLMKPITRAAGGVLDDRLEAVAHDLLERHPLLDDRVAAAAVEQRLLDAREAAAQQADDEVVLVVGLRPRRAPAVEVLQERHEAIGDRREDVAVPPLVRDWRHVDHNRRSHHGFIVVTAVRLWGIGRWVFAALHLPARSILDEGVRGSPMDSAPPLTGDALLSAITASMVSMHHPLPRPRPGERQVAA